MRFWFRLWSTTATLFLGKSLPKSRGFTIKYANVNPDGTLDYDDFESKLCSKTKIACLSHVSNVTGVINDVKRIGKGCT